jgi:hypothetical protein
MVGRVEIGGGFKPLLTGTGVQFMGVRVEWDFGVLPLGRFLVAPDRPMIEIPHPSRNLSWDAFQILGGPGGLFRLALLPFRL